MPPKRKISHLGQVCFFGFNLENKKNVDIMSFVGIWEFTWKIKKAPKMGAVVR